jgi:hypothetical protein
VAQALERLTARVDVLSAHGETANGELLREVQQELRGLSQNVVQLQADVAELYSRLGQPYPAPSPNPADGTS